MRERMLLLGATALAGTLFLFSPLIAQDPGASAPRPPVTKIMPPHPLAYASLFHIRATVQAAFDRALEGAPQDERKRVRREINKAFGQLRAGLANAGLTLDEVWGEVEGLHVALLAVFPGQDPGATFLAALETKDPDWARRLLEEKIEVFLPDPPKYQGVKIYESPEANKPFAAAALPGYLVMGNDRKALEACIDRVKEGASESLADNPIFRSLVTGPAPDRYLQGFVDVPSLLLAVRPQLPAPQRAEFDKADTVIGISHLLPATFWAEMPGPAAPGSPVQGPTSHAVGHVRIGIGDEAAFYNIIRQRPGKTDLTRFLPAATEAALVFKIHEPARMWDQAQAFLVKHMETMNPEANRLSMPQIKGFIGNALGLPLDQLFESLGDLAVIVYRPERPPRTPREAQSNGALVVEGSDAESLRAAWEKILKGPAVANGAGTERSEEACDGVPIVTVGEEDNDKRFAYAIVDKYLVLGKTAEAVKPALTAYRTRATGTAAAPAAFPEPASKWLSLDLAGAAKLLGARDPKDPGQQLAAALAPYLGRVMLTTVENRGELQFDLRADGIASWIAASPAGPFLGAALTAESLKPLAGAASAQPAEPDADAAPEGKAMPKDKKKGQKAETPDAEKAEPKPKRAADKEQSRGPAEPSSAQAAAASAPSGREPPPDPGGVARRLDDLVRAGLARRGSAASPPADDATFLRRATLDLAGRIPTPREADDFRRDAAPDKRARLVDRLLASDDFAAHWASFWRVLLLGREMPEEAREAEPLFDRWLRERIGKDVPVPEWARALLNARGSLRRGARGIETDAPELLFTLRHAMDPAALAERTSSVFLGVSLRCARCHNHPHERWTQNDFWGMAAYFSGLDSENIRLPGGKRVGVVVREGPPRPLEIPASAFGGSLGAGERPRAAPRPLTGPSARSLLSKVQGPVPEVPDYPESAVDLGHRTVDDAHGGRAALADWLTAQDNPWFAKAVANRVWAYLLGRGIVDPPDGFGDLHPPSHPELLECLAETFRAGGGRLKPLIAAIARSEAYGRASTPAEGASAEAVADALACARLRPLSPEQLFNAIALATGADAIAAAARAEQTKGLREALDKAAERPPASPAVMENLRQALARVPTPDALRDERLALFRNLFRTADEDPHRVRPGLTQALALLNADWMERLTQAVTAGGAVRKAIAEESSPAGRVRRIYWAALGREPRPEEVEAFRRRLAAGAASETEPYEDLLWALINATEFFYNH